MADAKITALTSGSSVIAQDLIPYVNVTGSVTQAITISSLLANVSVLGDASFRNITATSVIGVNTKVGGGVGYITGAGSIVTQGTGGKSVTIVCNSPTGALTLNNSVMAASLISSFIVANSCIGVSDIFMMQHVSGGTLGGYSFAQSTLGGGQVLVKVRNNVNAAASEAIVVGYAIIKSAAS